MTTTVQGEKSIFIQNMKKDAIKVNGDNLEEELEIDIDDVNITIERKSCLSTNGSSYGDFWSKDNINSSVNEETSCDHNVCTIINIDNGRGEVNGKTDGNNNCNNNQDLDSDDEEITQEDVEAIHEQLIKANAILNEQVIKLQADLSQSSSILQRRLELRKELGQIVCQKQKYQKQNAFLKSLCLNKFSKRFHDQVEKSLDKINQLIKTDFNYIVQSRSLLDSSQDPGNEFRSSKSAQTIRTSAFKGSESTDKAKNNLITSLKIRNSQLIKQLEQIKSKNQVLPIKGPSVMLIKKDDYLELLESAKDSKKNERTKIINCDQIKTKPGNKKIETIKPKPKLITSQTIEVKKESSDLTNGDSKRQFYICKCGLQFSKNALGYKAAYDSFRQHVAKCSVYMKNGAVCDICDAPFHSIPCLKVHIRRIHPERPELLEKYRHIVSCPCGKIFDNYSQECTAIKALRKHARVCPSYRSKAIFCSICKEPFLEPNQLNNHIRMAHSTKPNGSTGQKSSTVSKPSTSSVAKKRKVN